MQTLTIARFEDLALAQPIQRAVAEEGYYRQDDQTDHELAHIPPRMVHGRRELTPAPQKSRPGP